MEPSVTTASERKKLDRIYSAREVAEELNLTHHEVIRRIRRGDIQASKVGWNYILTEEAVEAAKNSDWYKRRVARINS